MRRLRGGVERRLVGGRREEEDIAVGECVMNGVVVEDKLIKELLSEEEFTNGLFIDGTSPTLSTDIIDSLKTADAFSGSVRLDEIPAPCTPSVGATEATPETTEPSSLLPIPDEITPDG